MFGGGGYWRGSAASLQKIFCFMSCERSMTHKGALFSVAGACTLLMHDWSPTRPVIRASAPIISAQQTDGICLLHIEEYILEYIFCADFWFIKYSLKFSDRGWSLEPIYGNFCYFPETLSVPVCRPPVVDLPVWLNGLVRREKQRWDRLCHITCLRGQFFFLPEHSELSMSDVGTDRKLWNQGLGSGMWPPQVTKSAVATTLALWTGYYSVGLSASGVYLLRFSVIQVMFVSDVLKYWANGVVEAVSEINFLTYQPRWLFFVCFCVTNITVNFDCWT